MGPVEGKELSPKHPYRTRIFCAVMVLGTIWVGAIVGAKKVEAIPAAAIKLKMSNHSCEMSFPAIKRIVIFNFYNDECLGGASLSRFNYVGRKLASKEFDWLFGAKEIGQP